MVGALFESEHLEEFEGSRCRCSLRFSGDQRRHRHILGCCKFRQQLMVLKHKTDIAVAELGESTIIETAHFDAIVDDAAGVGMVEGAGDLKEGGLAGAAGSDYRYNLVLSDGETHFFEYSQRAIRFVDIFQFYHVMFDL